ncbi:MAG TPA: matrixin family metalloprotease [Actinotalea sp.]
MDRAARRRTPSVHDRARTRGAFGLAALAGLALGGALALQASGWDLGALTRPRAFVEVAGQAVAVPRAAETVGRLLPAVEATTTGSYAFLHVTPDGGPVGYDPCRQVRYVVRPDHMPSSGQALIEDAVSIVSAATGLSFVSAGTTEEAPAVDRQLIQDRYGPGWAPVLIAWSDEQEMPELAGQVAGVGGSAAVPGSDGQGQWLAAGRVVLDTVDLNELLARPGGYERARAVLVHELSHVVGLDHVDDRGELMAPITAARTDLGPGDREGLALVGQVACEP